MSLLAFIGTLKTPHICEGRRSQFKTANTAHIVCEEMKNMEDRFTQGFVAACAVTLRNHGCDTIVSDTLACCGPVSVAWYRRLGVDESDIEILLPVINEIKRKRRTSCAQEAVSKHPTTAVA